MSADCVPRKSNAFTFICPSCQAEYQVVTVAAPSDMHHRKTGCLRCDALFPAGEGNVFLRYILMTPRRGR
jgi:hypothetical protein